MIGRTYLFSAGAVDLTALQNDGILGALKLPPEARFRIGVDSAAVFVPFDKAEQRAFQNAIQVPWHLDWPSDALDMEAPTDFATRAKVELAAKVDEVPK